MLQLRDVVKTYALTRAGKRDPVPALCEVSLDVPVGLLTAVLGPSGSGKSTLLRVIAGFERPDSGSVMLDGAVLAGRDRFVRPERRGIGIVPQDGALFPHLDVAHNIAFGMPAAIAARFGRAGRRERARRVAQLLEMVGLPGYEGRRADELSGGEQQRVALARALMPNPQIVLLDEPFSAIDAALRTELAGSVRTLLRELGVTTVLVTHDQSEALSLADQVVVMREGRIAQAGTPRQVYELPADAATARFVGDAMVLPAHVVPDGAGASRVRCLLGELPVAAGPQAPAGSECHVVLRPEHLILSEANGSPTSRLGTPARVVASAYYGHDALLTVELDTEQGESSLSSPATVPPTIRVRTHDLDPSRLVGRRVQIEVCGPALVLS